MMRYVVGELRLCSKDSHCSDTPEQICEGRLCRCPVGTVLHYKKCVASLSEWKFLIGVSGWLFTFHPRLDDGILQMPPKMETFISIKVYKSFVCIHIAGIIQKMMPIFLLKIIPKSSLMEIGFVCFLSVFFYQNFCIPFGYCSAL